MSLKEEVLSKRAEVLTAAARYGLRNIRLFGSAVRGDEGEDSDLDFLVELAPEASGLGLGGFLMDMQSLFGRPVDVATERMLKDRYRDRVLSEAVQI